MKTKMLATSKKTNVYIAMGGLFIALGVLFPQLFHIFGAQIGKIMLPMHIFVFVSGMLLGPYLGMTVGIVTPILSFLIMGMPAVPQAFFMMLELGTYGFIAGLFRKLNIFLTLFIAQFLGRIIYALGMYIFGVFGIGGGAAAVLTGVSTGLPGIILQYVLVSVLVILLRKRVLNKFE